MHGPDLRRLIAEGTLYLRTAFGEPAGAVVQVHRAWPDGQVLITATLVLPVDWSGDGEAALAAFDAAWWQANVHRSSGRLVFDYQVASINQPISPR